MVILLLFIPEKLPPRAIIIRQLLPAATMSRRYIENEEREYLC